MDRCPTHCRTVYLVRTNWREDPGAGVTRNSRRSARDSGTLVLPTNDAGSTGCQELVLSDQVTISGPL